MSNRHWTDRFRRLPMILALVVGLIGVPAAVAIGMAGPASASTSVGTNDYPTAWQNATDCSGTYGQYSWCISGNDISPLGFGYRNCTDYVAYELNEQMGGDTGSNKKFSYSIDGFSNGNASGWQAAIIAKFGSQASNNTPGLGSVAWYNSTWGGGFGHVALVSGITYNSDGSVKSITVSDYNYAGTGVYDSYTINSGASNWPDAFLHVADVTIAPPPSPAPSYVMVREGDWVGAKQHLDDPWTALAAGATDIQAAGNRFAYLTSTGELYAKDGINGSWYDEYSGVNQYVLTPDYLMIRVGTWIAVKQNLDGPWVTLASADTTDIQAAESSTNIRFAYLDSSGNFYVKDGLNGAWDEEYTGVSQYVITGDYMMIDAGGWLAAKQHLTDSWTSLMNTNTTDIQMAESSTNLRIAFLDSSGNFYVKDGLNGAWDEEYTGVSQFAITPSTMYIRVGTWLAAKAVLQDAWTSLETTNTTDIQAADQADGTTWFAFMDSTGELYVKDGLGGSWYDEANVSQYVIPVRK